GRGHRGMRCSLVGRGISAAWVEDVVEAERVGGTVLLAGGDNSLPGRLMGLPADRTVDPGRERERCVSFEDFHETAPRRGRGEGLTSMRVLSREDRFISTMPFLPGPPHDQWPTER
ncbi:hypothetical protein D8M34_17905, partial [Microbacterium sp. HSID17254]